MAGCLGRPLETAAAAFAARDARLSFSLEDPDGHAVTDADFHGEWTLVYFGYTGCPDVCPSALAAIARLLDHREANDAAALNAVFIALDPDRDSPILNDYTAFFHPEIVGLVGAEDAIDAAAARADATVRRFESADGEAVLIDHSVDFRLFAPDGRLAARIRHDQSNDAIAERVATTMKDWTG
ncbi:MAG: SCO family protein [Pseudomonadota bacterium]